MTEPNPHEAYFREVLEALYSGNPEPLIGAISDDYVCHTPGRSCLAGDYHGRDQFEIKRPKMRALVGDTFRVRRIAPVCIHGDWAMVPVEVSAEAAGRKLNVPAFGIWRFRDDRIVEHWEGNFDQHSFDEFIDAAEAAQI